MKLRSGALALPEYDDAGQITSVSFSARVSLFLEEFLGGSRPDVEEVDCLRRNCKKGTSGRTSSPRLRNSPMLNSCCLSTIIHRTLYDCMVDSYNPVCSQVEDRHPNGEGYTTH